MTQQQSHMGQKPVTAITKQKPKLGIPAFHKQSNAYFHERYIFEIKGVFIPPEKDILVCLKYWEQFGSSGQRGYDLFISLLLIPT